MKLLKKEYKRRSQLRPLFWDNTIQLPIEQVYTRLKIISRGKLAIQRKDDDVNVFDIFNVPDIGEDVMTIVEGSPGIGKTTFCLKLAYDWAHGNIPSKCSFPKFEFVFLLKCRDIDGDLMEAISEQLLPRKMEKSVENLLHLMKDIHNQERLILIILDGLDELPEKSRHHVDELLHRRILPFCYVLATTRQERGIEVRKSVVFDIHLEIKGYTESDAIAYVRRHFGTIDQSPKGERLIEEMEQNTFLHALRSNPLNLLLLCVVYEDYDGNLPTSRTELYQVIVQCLLRRYCAKHNLAVPEDNNTLQKRFEEDILALGELAWACLRNDRQSFREGELAEREVENQNLVARKIGLLYKEESLKRISPQHEYWFLHKTFQEYLAAAFITHKLLRGENVFEFMTFDDLVRSPQVFLFVCGMLGEKATVLFAQIGEKLNEKEDWYWDDCSQQEAMFFVEIFSESEHAEQMATILCNIKPFPEVVYPTYSKDGPCLRVLMACKCFSNVKTPAYFHAELFENKELDPNMTWIETDLVIDCIESLSNLTIVSLGVFDSVSLRTSHADRLCKWLSVSKSLSEFILKLEQVCVDGDVPVLLGKGLALCQTVTKVKLAVPGYGSEAYFNVLETGLSADNQLTSVVVEIYGSVSSAVVQALQKLLSNKSLTSLSLSIYGDVQDLLASAVNGALARQSVLKSLDLRLSGKLSPLGANLLQKGLLENSSLNSFKVIVHGELPSNWQSVVENLYSRKKSLVTCTLYPNTLDNIAEEHVDFFWPEKELAPKQHLTVNVWGELNCEGAQSLCKVFGSSSFAYLTLNVRGNLAGDVIFSIASDLEGSKTPSFLTVNIWGNLTPEGRTILSKLSKNNPDVHFNVHDVPEESNHVLDISIDNPAALRAFSAKVKNKDKVSLSINHSNKDVIKDMISCLGDALAENPSMTSLDLTVNSCCMDEDLGEDLGKRLLQSTSLTSLGLTLNCGNLKEGWACKLGDCLMEMATLATLSLELNDCSEWNEEDFLGSYKLRNVLVENDSLSTLSVAIPSGIGNMFLKKVIDHCLLECKSLKNLSLVFSICDYCLYLDTLDSTTSLNTLTLAISISHHVFEPAVHDFFENLYDGLSSNASLTTLTVSVSLYNVKVHVELDRRRRRMFEDGLSKNKSITTLSFTINEFGGLMMSYVGRLLSQLRVFEGLAQNTSITTFNLTLNSNKEVTYEWLPALCDALKKNSSLTTLRLKVNIHCARGESRLYDFSKLMIESKSLSLLELEVSIYGKENNRRFYSQ